MAAVRAERSAPHDQAEQRYGPAETRDGSHLLDPTANDDVREFQRRNRLDDDGVIGPQTQAAIRAVRAERERTARDKETK